MNSVIFLETVADGISNDTAQQRPGEKLASAPEASQKSTRTQGQANFKIQTLKRIGSQPDNINAASLTDRNMETSHIIHIHGRHSPLARSDLTTHAIKQRLQRPQCSTKIRRQQPTPLPLLARYHSFGEGHNNETPGNTQATATAQYTHSTLLKSSNLPMAAARRRQGQQLYAWHGTPSRRPQAATPFPLTLAGEAIQLQPPALLPEAWPCKCNTIKTKQPKRDKANGCRKEEARASTLCMAWHAQQICGRGHSASTTSDAARGVAMRVQYKQGQTAKER